MLADGRSPVWHPTLAGEFGACSIEFALPQRREQIACEDDTLAVAARQPLLHQVIGPSVYRRAGLRTETAKRYRRVRFCHQPVIEPGGAERGDLFVEVNVGSRRQHQGPCML